MQLTDEQRNAICEPGHVCLVSCPGSGKTRAIVAKMFRCIDDVSQTTRRVACITHTNAAADEIDNRLRRLCFGDEDQYYEVATIHAFALQNILNPFHHYLPELAEGFSILTSDTDEYVNKAQQILNQYGLHNGVMDEFQNINRNPNGSINMLDSLPNEVQEDWCRWLDENGYVTFSDMVYHAGRLVSRHSHISSALASCFKWILVDEFQDSSPGQILILREIYGYGRTNFFCVGDPNQSIYGFAGASPELLTNFAVHVGAVTRHRLSGNFRSSRRIINVAEMLCPNEPPMQAVGDYSEFHVDPVHYRVASPVAGISNHFLPALTELNISLGEAAILAPWWIPLFNLGRQLRQNGIPVIGPGARPYRRQHLIAQFLEALGAYLETGDGDSALIVQRALFILLTSLADRAAYDVYSYKGRIVVCKILAAARISQMASPLAVHWIINVAAKINEIISDLDVPQSDLRLITDSAAAMVSDILQRDQGNRITTADMGIFARPKDCLQLLTVHKAKGHEFQAVAVVDVHDGRFPHFTIANIANLEERRARYNESRRVIYVAVTRAKKLLMLFTDSSNFRNRPSPFLAEMGLL